MSAAATFWFVAIGASGPLGLNDIGALLRKLSPSLNAAVLIVLHRPWGRASHLQSTLSHWSRMPIVVASQGERFEADVTYTGLAEKLNAKGWTESQASVASKLSRGAFTATFFLAALAEIGVEVVRLGEI